MMNGIDENNHYDESELEREQRKKHMKVVRDDSRSAVCIVDEDRVNRLVTTKVVEERNRLLPSTKKHSLPSITVLDESKTLPSVSISNGTHLRKFDEGDTLITIRLKEYYDIIKCHDSAPKPKKAVNQNQEEVSQLEKKVYHIKRLKNEIDLHQLESKKMYRRLHVAKYGETLQQSLCKKVFTQLEFNSEKSNNIILSDAGSEPEILRLDVLDDRLSTQKALDDRDAELSTRFAKCLWLRIVVDGTHLVLTSGRMSVHLKDVKFMYLYKSFSAKRCVLVIEHNNTTETEIDLTITRRYNFTINSISSMHHKTEFKLGSHKVTQFEFNKVFECYEKIVLLR